MAQPNSPQQDDPSSMSFRIPHGQTRRLALLFDEMADAVIVEKQVEHSHLQKKRSPRQKVPTRKGTPKFHEQHDQNCALWRGSFDESFLESSHSGHKKCSRSGPQGRNKDESANADSTDDGNSTSLLRTQSIKVDPRFEITPVAKNSSKSFVWPSPITPRSHSELHVIDKKKRSSTPLKEDHENGNCGQCFVTTRMVLISEELNDSPQSENIASDVSTEKLFAVGSRTESIQGHDTNRRESVQYTTPNETFDWKCRRSENSSDQAEIGHTLTKDATSDACKESAKMLRGMQDTPTRGQMEEESLMMQASSSQDSPRRILNCSEISSITESGGGTAESEYDYMSEIERLNERIAAQQQYRIQMSDAPPRTENCDNRLDAADFAEVYSHREELLCCKRCEALERELKRVEMLQLVGKKLPQLSQAIRTTFKFSSITVHLDRNFCAKFGGGGDRYAFVALLKAGCEVYATEAVIAVSSRTAEMQSVRFNETIQFTDLPLNFSINVEIYTLKLRDRQNGCCAPLRRARLLLSRRIYVSEQSESPVESPKFTCSGTMVLNRDRAATQTFCMNNVRYPLEGAIEFEFHCSAIPPHIEGGFSGFLMMYEVISGRGTWVRYWAVLRRGIILVWKNPNDAAANKRVVTSMDLTGCFNAAVKRVASNSYMRANMFSMDILVSDKPPIMEMRTVLFSTNTKEQCLAWLHAINQTLTKLRT